MDDYNVYSDDYIIKQPAETIEQSCKDKIKEIVVEEVKYGINKPIRKIIKAKISHDKD